MTSLLEYNYSNSMALAAGNQLGSYEIVALLGAGGMGEVYRARDRKLKRDVALKVLPEAFAGDLERMTRFQREAEVLASLNHPNIAAIYGLEGRALVMELVEGESPKGPMVFEEACKVASQMADALEYAHDRGIVHRDLKPANIKITPEGVVKLLDFGLAKALTPQSAAAPGSIENSPTLTLGATQLGVILGTASYMAPEQAVGKTVDKRADIWSFGVVLWEMLTGKRLFDGGETVSHTLADVLRAEIDFGKLPSGIPEPIRELLKRCLDRNAKNRLRDIGEARVAIQQWRATPEVPIETQAQRSLKPSPYWLTIAAAAGIAIGGGVVYWAPWKAQPVPDVVRFQVPPPEKTFFGPNAPPGISPDSRKLAFIVNGDGPRLWVRSLDSLEARALPGTEGAAASIIWSPDSRSIAYWTFAPNTLKRIDLAGGPPQLLCNTNTQPATGAWTRDNVIIFHNGGGLSRVPAGGGDCTPLTALDTSHGETAHRFPSLLPDGQHFVYLREGRSEYTGIYVGSLDDKPAQQSSKRVLAVDDRAIYAPSPVSKQGFLLFRREGTLMAQSFDTGRLELIGDSVPVAEQVAYGNPGAGGVFSASMTGAIAYRTGPAGGVGNLRLTWFDRQGKVAGTARESVASSNQSVSYSSDGKQAAFTAGAAGQSGNQDIWLYEFARGTSTPFTSDPALDTAPVWSPDDKQIVFASEREGGRNLYRKSSSNTSSEELLFKSNEPKTPTDWGCNGRFLLFDSRDAKDGLDIIALSNPGGTPGDAKAIPYLKTPANERQARFSPDCRFVAYASDLSGRTEIYVQTFPDSKTGKRVKVSQGGGQFPHWRRDGKELFYSAGRGGGEGAVMSVEVNLTPEFKVGIPKPLFRLSAGSGTSTFDVTGDGKTFIKLESASVTSDAPEVPITVVLNWAAGLRK